MQAQVILLNGQTVTESQTEFVPVLREVTDMSDLSEESQDNSEEDIPF